MATLQVHQTNIKSRGLLKVEVERTNQTFVLQDGRLLGYAQYGDPLGKPVFFFHGGAGSRLERPANISAIGARIITTDRPGHGLSEYQDGRTLLDWPDDVKQLADHLGIEKFYVLGWSAGGPHALACSYKLPNHVLAGAVAAGIAPPEWLGSTKTTPLSARLFSIAASNLPGLIRLFRRMANNMVRGNPEKVKQQLVSSLPEDESDYLISSGNLNMLYSDMKEGYRQGWRGVAHDDLVIFRDWGFDIADIKVRIDIWHGLADRQIPSGAGKYLQTCIPHSRGMFLAGEGHLFLLSYWAKVIQALVEDQEDG